MRILTVRTVYDRLWRCTSEKTAVILPRERDIGDSSLSGKELQAANESVRNVANDCARARASPPQRNPVAALGRWGSKLYGKRDSL